MVKYYFIDKEIYLQGVKMPDRKVELFNVENDGADVYANDIDGNLYILKQKI